jgi:hypothetical protein
MNEIERAGWRIQDWCMGSGIPVSSYYTLRGERAPRKVSLGARRVRIIESPKEYLERIADLQKEAA